MMNPAVHHHTLIIAAEVAASMQQTLPHSGFAALPRSRSPVPRAVPRRFSRRLFGADPAEVNQVLTATEDAVSDLVAALDHERTVLEARLQNATAEIAELRVQLDAAEQCSAVYREQEGVIARALVTAQQAADDLTRTAQAEADEIVGKAEVIANDIVQIGCRNASEILQKAQQDADGILDAAREKAGAYLAALRTEADRLILDAHQTFQAAQRTVEEQVASLSARLSADLANPGAAAPAEAGQDIAPPSAPPGPIDEADPRGGGGEAARPSEAATGTDSDPAPASQVRFLDGALACAVTGGAMSIVYLLRRLLGDAVGA